MVNEHNPKVGFEPLHKGHAIEQMTIAVQMSREIDDSAIKAIKKAIGAPPELPRRLDLQGITVAFGLNVPTPRPSQSAGNIGYSFAKFNDAGTVDTELRAERSAITFLTTRYTAWIHVWPQVRKYFEVLIPHYIPSVEMSGITVSYVDRFIWNDPETRAEPTQMLRPNSIFLCPNIYKANDLWHSHTGWFERIDTATKRLVNVNVDFLETSADDELRRAIVIKTVLTDFLNQPGYERSNPDSAAALGIIEHHLNQLHDFCKEVLSDIIKEEMSIRIALKG
jgi:uncharacterized protein (TIGR04255 family)